MTISSVTNKMFALERKLRAAKLYGGDEVHIPAFLIPALDGAQQSLSGSGRLIPRERALLNVLILLLPTLSNSAISVRMPPLLLI
jgi:hypothetical protein